MKKKTESSENEIFPLDPVNTSSSMICSYLLRYIIWQDNSGYCADYNSKSQNMKLAMNKFGDLTLDEFHIKMNGYLTGAAPTSSSFASLNKLALPKEVNLVKKGYVTSVKDQRECASCYAFSTVSFIHSFIHFFFILFKNKRICCKI